MDLDGDGVISMYELQYFYEDQLNKMIELGMETLCFQDCLCQVCLFPVGIEFLLFFFSYIAREFFRVKTITFTWAKDCE